MKRINGTPTRLLRVKLLPGCLALALVVGSNVLSPEYANAQASLANASRSNEPFVAAAHTAGLPGSERQALIERMQSAARTPPPVPAASIAVSNCNDSGPGSYRQAVLDAVSGDTIDLTSTGCSTITLTTGDVQAFQNDLTLQGPGALALSIDGGSLYRPLEHLGTGALHINDLMIAHGTKYLSASALGNASGGCVHSEGVVSVDHAWVKYCDAGSASTTGVKGGAIYGKAGVSVLNSLVTSSTVHSSGSFAYGGGVFSAGDLVVAYSQISGNTAHSTVTWGQGGGAEAGSIIAGGPTLIKYSTIQNNVAIGGGTTQGLGGGLYTTGNVYIDNSTIAGNQADFAGGLELQNGANVTAPFSINSSTISGNNSTRMIGGVYVGQNPTQIKNSTIAFNTAHTNPNKYGAGLKISAGAAVDLQSTIIARNTTDQGSGPLIDDVGGDGGASLTGANNLIMWASSLTTPPDTILLTDPMLGSLQSNGGPTSTHALSPLSPAINTGNNSAGFSWDQRGSGYPRVIGAGPDIGAFELNLNDVIFANGFD
jgi:hypothetical protein